MKKSNQYPYAQLIELKSAIHSPLHTCTARATKQRTAPDMLLQQIQPRGGRAALWGDALHWGDYLRCYTGEGAKRPSEGGWGEGISPLPHQGVFALWIFKRLQNMCLLKRGMTGEGEKRPSGGSVWSHTKEFKSNI